MTRYAEEKLKLDKKIYFSGKITTHLIERGTDHFNKLGVASNESVQSFETFLLEELNFKACILRELCNNNTTKSPDN